MNKSSLKFPFIILGALTLSSCSLIGEKFIDPSGNKMIINKNEINCFDSRGQNVTVGIFGMKMSAYKSDDSISCLVNYQYKDKNGRKRKAELKSSLKTNTGLHYCAVQREGNEIEYVNNDTLICKIANKYGKVKAAIIEAQKWEGGSFQGLGREQENY